MIHAPNEADALIYSKLRIPSPPRHGVHRPQLIARLNDGLHRKAAFVVAPAGYGKTTLVADWASKLDRPVAWLSLDGKDNDLVRFWRYVAKAVEKAQGGESDSAVSAAAATLAPGQYESFLVSLLNVWNGLREPLAIVFDDWHVIDDGDITASVSFLLEYLPPQVHLVFASRIQPTFSKTRWVSREWIHDIPMERLRFDLRETVELFRANTAHRELRREELERLLHRTEGWVTGLKLLTFASYVSESTTQSLQGGVGGRLEQFLLEEVFHAMDETTRRFLTSISVLQRMNGPLCEALAGTHGATKLAELAASNLFLIPLDEEGEWFRFHHLFGEFLLKQLKTQNTAEADALYRTAGAWCESRQLTEEAVDYYLAGRAYPEAIRLLEQMRSIVIRREFTTLRTWLSAIPEPLLVEHQYLYFSYIFSLLWANEPETAERYLQQAERHYEAARSGWDEEKQNRFLGYLFYVRNFKATSYDMDVMKGLEYIRLSLRHSPKGTDLIFASPHTPLAPSIFRSYNGKRGEHLPRGMSDTFFSSMIEFMSQMGLQGSTQVCYGELLYERNELDEAERYLKLGLQGRSQANFQPEKVYVPASLFLSRIANARRDFASAEAWLEDAVRRARADGAAEAPILLDAELAAFRLDRGDPADALDWVERYKLSADDPVSVYQLFVYTFLVRVLMETGRASEALGLAEKLHMIAVKNHRPMDAIELEALQATLLQRLDRREQALLTLEEALRFAESDDYVRVFVDKGPALAELFTEYVRQRLRGNFRDRSTPSLAFVRKVLSCFGAGAPPGTAEPAESALASVLTPRELAIFGYMEEGRGNAEIAVALGIGMGTLKAHINHIYSKLQATSRVEAIRRGKELQG
ncbi:LuxR C-terminal-related transcriptional regulator [Paenibacillus chartarius]|uniref:LuxR C-terminal-related transcriptional regulator n=1 Tax=Paenibacillus chartarius TaxID=747481 RepID=A0ABV6DPP3_9BACL